MTDIHEHSAAHPTTHEEVDYERSDSNLRQIVVVGILSVIVLGASFFAVEDYFSLGREEVMQETSLSVLWPGLRAIHISEAEALTKYKLLNADSGRYQIPIERAMKLLADEAFQKRESGP